MAKITFHGNAVNTVGSLPANGSQAPDFKLTANNLSEKALSDYRGKQVILNIFPSLDTGTCAASVRTFNKEAAALDNTVVLCVSRDLPFAQKRFCEAEGIKNVEVLSEFRDTNFSDAYPVKMTDGPLAGLFSRSVIVLDPEGKVKYSEHVSEVTDEPDYAKAISQLS